VEVFEAACGAAPETVSHPVYALCTAGRAEPETEVHGLSNRCPMAGCRGRPSILSA
jgi:hypothetical protein